MNEVELDTSGKDTGGSVMLWLESAAQTAFEGGKGLVCGEKMSILPT